MFKGLKLTCFLQIVLLFGCGPLVESQAQGENEVVKPDFSQLSDAIFSYQFTEEKLVFGVDREVLVDSLAKLSFALESLSTEQVQYISEFNNQYLSELRLKIHTVKEIWALKRAFDRASSKGFYENNINVFSFPTKDNGSYQDSFNQVRSEGYNISQYSISNIKRFLSIFPNAFYLSAGNYDEHQIELSDKVIGELIAYDITYIGGVRLDQEPKLINFFQLVDSIDFSESGPYGRTSWSSLSMRSQYAEIFSLISDDVKKLKGLIKNLPINYKKKSSL